MIQSVDNEQHRKDVWTLVYSQVFASLYIYRMADASRFGAPLDQQAQAAADEAIANIPRTVEVMTLQR